MIFLVAEDREQVIGWLSCKTFLVCLFWLIYLERIDRALHAKTSHAERISPFVPSGSLPQGGRLCIVPAASAGVWEGTAMFQRGLWALTTLSLAICSFGC